LLMMLYSPVDGFSWNFVTQCLYIRLNNLDRLQFHVIDGFPVGDV